MRAISIVTLASLATGLLAQNLGTFDTFGDTDCATGLKSVTVEDSESHARLPTEVRAVKSHLEDCAIQIWSSFVMAPQVIPAGDNSCVKLEQPGRHNWDIRCDL